MADSRVAHLKEYLNTELIPYYVSQGMSKTKARHTALAYLKDAHPDVYQKVVPVKKQHGGTTLTDDQRAAWEPQLVHWAKENYGGDFNKALEGLKTNPWGSELAGPARMVLEDKLKRGSGKIESPTDLLPLDPFQIGNSLLAEGYEALKGRPYDLFNPLYGQGTTYPGGQRTMSEVTGVGGVPGFALDMLDPAIVGAGLRGIGKSLAARKIKDLAKKIPTSPSNSPGMQWALDHNVAASGFPIKFKSAPDPSDDWARIVRRTSDGATSADVQEAHALAKKLQSQGLVGSIPDNPAGFDKWLDQQYNTKPLYRVVDVNPDLMRDPIIRQNIASAGLNPDDPYDVAKYMGTTVAPNNVFNRGRRSGGHEELVKGTNKDILYYSNDPTWLGPRYGGENPYYVKVYKDQMPEGLINKVLRMRTTSQAKKNYNRHFPDFDINKVPSGSLFEDGYLQVGHNSITPILGDRGAKVRDAIKVVDGQAFNRLSNKFFQQGGGVQKSQKGIFTIPDFVNRESEPDYNAAILQLADSLEGGGYNWDPSGSGSPYDIEHNSAKILAKQAEGTYCSGYTCGVSLKAMQDSGLLKDLDDKQLADFKQIWYGAKDYKKGDKESLSTAALQKYGLGYEVPHESAKPGDIAQIWRKNGSGHSVIFKDWVYDDDKNVVGIKYRSTQKATKGVGDRTEMFGDKIDPSQIYLARIGKQNRPPLRKKGALSKKRK